MCQCRISALIPILLAEVSMFSFSIFAQIAVYYFKLGHGRLHIIYKLSPNSPSLYGLVRVTDSAIQVYVKVKVTP